MYMCVYDMSNMYNMYIICICHHMPLDQIERPKTEALSGKSIALSSDINSLGVPYTIFDP